MSVETPDETYWRLVRVKAEEYKADGCPGVTEIRRDACLEHDLHVGTLESDGVVALGGRASVALS